MNNFKYKQFWCRLESDVEGTLWFVFSSTEDETKAVWKIRADNRTFHQALNMVYEEIYDDIEKWWDRLFDYKREFYSEYFAEKVKQRNR